MRASHSGRITSGRPSTSQNLQSVIQRFSKTSAAGGGIHFSESSTSRSGGVRFSTDNFSTAVSSTLVTEVPQPIKQKSNASNFHSMQMNSNDKRTIGSVQLSNNKSQPAMHRISMVSPKKRMSHGVGSPSQAYADGQASPGQQQRQMRKEKKFGLQDYLLLEENYTDLQKAVRTYYSSMNNMLKTIGSDDLKEYLNSIWDIEHVKKDPKDLMPIIEALFSTIIQFYNAQEDELYRVQKLYKHQGDNELGSQSKDYLFLLQTQEAEARALTRECQQLRLSVQAYSEKLRNSETQGNLLASYAQKEMESLKQEFQFAISELKQREDDVDVLKKELQGKDEQLEQMEERLLSVFILEHKIRALGSKSTKDIEKTIFEYTEKLREVDKSSREALRKERQDNEQVTLDFRNKVNLLTQENRKLRFENKTRIQQLNDIIVDKDQVLQKKVVKLQDVMEKLALRNKEMYVMTGQKDRYSGSSASNNGGAGGINLIMK